MCGIYGEFFKKGTLTPKFDFLLQNDKNNKRGPDMAGYWTNGTSCQFGFRRLSILDLSALGNQPMASEDGLLTIVFNGEIYNFETLKKRLLSCGVIFKTTTDTEVLVNYISQFGLTETLEHIDGMFAFVVHDATDDSIYLVRDFAGIKPLFFSYTKEKLVFGSRYDLVSGHPLNKNASIDQEALYWYLKMHYLPAPFCIKSGTFQVLPGEVVKIDSVGKLTKKMYWQFPELKEAQLITNIDEAEALVAKTLENAVTKTLVADVAVGTFLSGGIDSPLVSYYAHAQHPNIQAYTIGSDSAVHDESEDALTYSKLIGCNTTLEKMTAKEALSILKESMANLGEPFADFSLIPTSFLCKTAKTNCTVMLSGDGGDELFFGYERFNSVMKNLPWQWLPKWLRYSFYGADKVFFNNKHINEAILETSLSKAHQGLHSRIYPNTLKGLFPKLKTPKQTILPCYDYSTKGDDTAVLHHMRKAEFYGMMQKTLVKVDRMSMAHSLEVRVPFLTKTMLEASFRIHPEIAYQKADKKIILKRLLNRLLPKAPINNVKRGFTVPLSKWLRQELKTPVENVLFNSQFLSTFEISESYLRTLWEEHQTQKRDHKWTIFTLYSLAIWHEQHG